MRFVIVSGRSGSGKTIAITTLEDLGFWCVDNLPLDLLEQLPNALSHAPKVAVSLDARNLSKQDAGKLATILANLKQKVALEIIYLDADDATLLRRFSETRRRHPLTSPDCDLQSAIRFEKKLLSVLATSADLIIDTSKVQLHGLKKLLRERLVDSDLQGPQILLQSFGFKYGHPADADIIFDTRCLPNPYWQDELRALNGRDALVQEFLNKSEDATSMVEDITNYLSKWIPKFSADNRRYLTIGIGCTGGQHRSVFVAEKIYQALTSSGLNVLIKHQQLNNT